MTSTLPGLSLAVAWFLMGTATSQHLTQAPPPAWVRPVECPVAQEDATGQVEILLLDLQINAAVPAVENFVHVVERVLNQEGIESESRIGLTFDPSYETLAVHSITIQRDGKTFDRLDLDRFQIIQREERLEALQYDGRKTALCFLEDVRIGDIIDYSYTRTGNPPVFGDHYSSLFPMQFSEKVQRLRTRLIWPDERTLNARSHGDFQKPHMAAQSGLREYIWDEANVPKAKFEDNMPTWFYAASFVEVSDFEDWGAVTQWGRELFKNTEASQESVMEIVQQIDGRNSNSSDRILQALRFVQREVRYMGLQLGEGTHRPSPPSEVLTRRFGDCKDKALLLVTLLRGLGFEAYPALVHTELRHTIGNRLPSPEAFNHVIVQVRSKSGCIWLDPTLNQGDSLIDECASAPYGLALVLAPETKKLSEIVAHIGVPTSTLINKDIVLRADGSAAITLRSTYKGQDAESLRGNIRNVDPAELQASLVEYFTEEYPTAKLKSPIAVKDDEESGTLVLTESYLVADAFSYGHEDQVWAAFYAREMDGTLMWPSTKRRTTPFAIPYPQDMTYAISVNLPKPLDDLLDKKLIRNDNFIFTRTTDISNRTLNLLFRFRTETDHVTVAQLPKYMADLEQVQDCLTYEVPANRGFALAAVLRKLPWKPVALVVGFLALILLSRRKRNEPQRILLSNARANPARNRAHEAPPPSLVPSIGDTEAPSLPSGWTPGEEGGGSVQTQTRPETATRLAPKVVETKALQAGPIVRDGKVLILHPTAALPGRCVRCNQPAEVIKTKEVRWHSPLLYLLLLPGIFIYLLVAMAASRKHRFEYAYCEGHARKHWQARLAMGAIFLVGLGALLGSPSESLLLPIGVILLHVAVIGSAVMGSRSIRAAFIDGDTVKLRGFGRPFLNSIHS